MEEKAQAAVHQVRALADQAEALARSLRDAAARFAAADQQELTLSGGTVLGAVAPSPFWHLPEGRLGGLPFIPVPRVAVVAGVALGGLTTIFLRAEALPTDWIERAWNWLHGRGWHTNAELAPPPQLKGRLYETIMRGLERARNSEQTRPPVDTAPLTAERDAAHPLRPADPRQGTCVQYAVNRRPDLRVTDTSIPGAADYIPYEKKGQVLRLRGTEADLRQRVKPGRAVVWPRGHDDLKGTDGWEWGHVAIVEEVYPDRIVVSQANWWFNGKPVPRMEIPRGKLGSLAVIL